MKKSQIKMFEAIAILVVFFFLLAFGFIFYTRVQKSTFESELEEKNAMKAIDIVQNAVFLPELQCVGEKCEKGEIDTLKLTPASRIINENALDYFYALGYSTIIVKEIYPATHEWILYNYTKGAEKISLRIPVPLYHPAEDMHSFGVINIDVYS